MAVILTEIFNVVVATVVAGAIVSIIIYGKKMLDDFAENYPLVWASIAIPTGAASIIFAFKLIYWTSHYRQELSESILGLLVVIVGAMAVLFVGFIGLLFLFSGFKALTK